MDLLANREYRYFVQAFAGGMKGSRSGANPTAHVVALP
jgi:hypothetical protein